MRLIGSIEENQQAENLVAFLLTEEIEAHVEEESGQFEIWIKDEDLIDRAVNEFNQFKSNPTDPKYASAIPKAREMQQEKIKKRQKMAQNIVSVSGGKAKRNNPLTIALVVICAVVALLTNFGNRENLTEATFRALAFNALTDQQGAVVLENNNGDVDAIGVRLASVSRGQIWRLVTPMFIHFGPFHLIFNMYWLIIFGSQIEHRYGSFWYALLILVSAAISNSFECTVPTELGGSAPGFLSGYFLAPLGGMSGVVYALFGFVLMRMTYVRSSNLFVPQSTVVLLFIWLVFCMTPLHVQLLGTQVANWAHATGLVVGLIAGYWPMIAPGQIKK